MMVVLDLVGVSSIAVSCCSNVGLLDNVGIFRSLDDIMLMISNIAARPNPTYSSKDNPELLSKSSFKLTAVPIAARTVRILLAFANLGAICSIIVDRSKVDMMFTFKIEIQQSVLYFPST